MGNGLSEQSEDDPFQTAKRSDHPVAEEDRMGDRIVSPRNSYDFLVRGRDRGASVAALGRR